MVERRAPAEPRSDLSAVGLGRRALVLGGYDATSVAVPSVLASTDGVRWRSVGTLPVPVRYAASAVLGHAVWLFGGERGGVRRRAVQRVDASGRARVVARLPRPLGHASALVLGGRILLAGGRTSATRPTTGCGGSTPRRRSFAPAGRLPRPLADAAVASDGETGYLVGGESPAVTDRVVRLRLR